MKLYNIFAIMLSAAAVCGTLTACSDDEPQVTPENPSVENTVLRPTSLAFSWHSIPGTNQYGYELTDPDGETVDNGVIKTTHIEFTGLQPATTYTLTVWAFNPVPGNTPSGKTVMELTTGQQIMLAAPGSLAVSYNSATGSFDATFNAVDNATFYHYELTGAEERSGDWTETGASFSNLATGDYALSVWADNDDPDYARSAPATVRFSVERVQLDQVTGLTISQDLEYSPETYIDFNKVANADRYLYTITGAEEKSGEFLYTQNNILLVPGDYTIELVAASNDPLFSNSPAVTQDFTVSQCELLPPAQSSISHTYSNGALTARWDAAPNATGYYFFLADANWNYIVDWDTQTTGTKYTYRGTLAPGTYCIGVSCITDSPYYTPDSDWSYYYFTIE
ncbi:MAG: hypothetical protein NC043_00070 [Muribaculaceae bacterium]|nr:hypothetical protein [Muribaculaceae bacterium]